MEIIGCLLLMLLDFYCTLKFQDGKINTIQMIFVDIATISAMWLIYFSI